MGEIHNFYFVYARKTSPFFFGKNPMNFPIKHNKMKYNFLFDKSIQPKMEEIVTALERCVVKV
jgi:hypothetical protein